MTPKLGFTEKQQQGVINLLNTVLADEHILYAKLRNYHWNVVGAQFFALHQMFEEQYNAIKQKADEIAERARAHGGKAIGTLTEFSEQARLQEKPKEYPDARTMVFNIVSDHETMVRNLREDAKICADRYNDTATEDLLIGLMQEHQEMAWMLRAFIEGEPVHNNGQKAGMPEPMAAQFARQ